MKKHFTLLLVVIALSMQSFAATNTKIGSLYYKLDANKKTAEVASQNKTSPYWTTSITSANIPSSVNYSGTTYRVTSIGSCAFRDCSGLTSVTIPNSVTSIGEWAFFDCSGLTSVTIPNNVTSIGGWAFINCTGLTSLNIGNSVTSIGDGAFSGCTNLTTVTIPNSVTSIGDRPFDGCTSLPIENNLRYADTYLVGAVDKTQSTYTIKEGTKWIGDYGFYNCPNLTAIEMPNSVTNIGDNAFNNCINLTSVEISNSVTNIGKNAFTNCSSLRKVTFGENFTHIGDDGLKGCTALDTVIWNAKNYTISDPKTTPFYSGWRDWDLREQIKCFTFGPNVVTIPQYLCCNMSGITSTIIPKSVTSIGKSAFYFCSSNKTVINLSYLYIVKGATTHGYIAYYASDVYTETDTIGDFVFAKSEDKDYLVSYLGNDCQITLPANYRGGSYGIGSNVFRKNTIINSITIPNSVTSIGDYAFKGCSNLNVVYIGNSVISIGTEAFFGCSELYKVIMLPNTVPTGINSAFETLPGRITYVGNTNYQSGYEVLGTQRIYSNLNSYFIVDGIVYALVNPSQRTCDIIDCDYSGATTEYSIGNSVVYRNITLFIDSINSNAFRNNQKMTKLNIDYNHALPSHMASGCTNIDTIIITSKGNIGTYAFNNCSKNSHAHFFVNNKGDISSNAFANCNKLYTIIIGDSVKNIGDSAFFQCGDIVHADIYNNGSIGSSAFRYSSTQDSATYHIHNCGIISESAFANCTSMKNLTIDSCVTSVGQYAFQGCSSLEDVSIKNKGEIGIQAFKGSSTQNPATYVVSNIGAINNYAFANCTSMKNLTIDSCVTSVGQYAFQGCSSLEEVTIKNRGDIGVGAFEDSSTQNPATYVVSNVGAINNNAFAYCSSMTNLTIDSCVSTIGQNAFRNCSSLEEVTIKNRGDIGVGAFEDSSTQNPATYAICNTGAIGESAFANCTSLLKGCLGKQITNIKRSAFKNCMLLDSITLPNAINAIGDSAFYNCQNLVFVQLNNQLTTIGKSAFALCSSLPEIFIPKSVASIGNSTFQQSIALAIVSFEDGSTPLSLGYNASQQGLFYDCPLDSLYIGRELTYQKSEAYGFSPFYRNPSLRSIVISNFPTKVEINEFYGCTNLYSVFIGNGVQSIGDYAFSGCSLIDYFSFGSQVQSIGAEAFSDCVSMTRLYSYCQTPPACGASALEDIDKWNCTLYIPEGTTNDYAAAEQWRDFFFVEENEEGSDGTKFTISVDFDASKGNVTGAGVYDRGTEVVLIATPAEGCIFVEWEDGSTNPERHISVFKSATYTAIFSAPTDVEVLDEEKESTGVMYDILGRPVSHPSHGIFIRNGEKILVK